MLYYEFKVKGKEKFSVPDSRDKEYHEWVREKNTETDTQNRQQAYNVHFYIVDAKPDYVRVFGIIGYKNKDNPKELAIAFVRGLGFDADSAEGGEIQIHTLGHLAHISEANGFIDDDDMILHQSAIGGRSECLSRDYSEFIVDDEYTIETAKKKAEKTNCGESLLREIDRIYTIQEQKTFVGNPVHYILYTEDWEVSKSIAHVLTSSLFANGRLKGKRVALMGPQKKTRHEMGFFDTDSEGIDMNLVSSLYNSQQGCAFVVKLGKVADEDKIAKEEDFHIEDMSKLISENKIETLSIIVLSKKEKKVAEQLKISLPKVRFVEIEEEPLFTDKAKEILKKKAETDNITKYDSLLEKLPNEEKSYYISDLNKIYNEWLNERLPVEVYPQYSEIKKVDLSLVKAKGSAFTKLQSLIGLKSVKEVIQQALDFNKARSLYDQAGIGNLKPSRHMIFTGNPGTAKTTVARLFAQIMKDNGVLDKGDLIEVGRKDLVGKYLGWTAKLVEQAFERAQGSVLFIDEAYSLCEERGGLYGEEAINTIVQMMENQRSDTVVIFAGYPDKMEKFIDTNPGLRSRIAFNVNFDDYSTDELVQIFNLMASENKVTLADGVTDRITKLFNDARKSKDFGNGRYVRNVFEHARMKQASRLVNMNTSTITEQIIRTLTVEDFSTAPVVTKKQESKILGFAC